MEEARQYSAVSRLGYRDWTVIWAVGFFILTLFLAVFLPESGGRYSLKSGGDLNWRGWAVVLGSLWLLLFGLPHLWHVIVRRLALEVDQGELRIWMIPYERIPLGEISRIEVGDGAIDIFRHGKPKRRINARVLNQPRAFFFDEVRSRMTNRDLVQEK
ncbi:hypothetical protein P7228_15000 [Altererythrobacter arenosus]|uniref:DUF304 domain-containing protein n=1 Tax=Altererythrobacter arenosus TaxID=3032592 RepID=A0ABY8FQI9_9SPHN|nr:hypothetical protein [Altererythrobacter sp. CAU 1644]WFL77277.1 hypothetical protein P7228_15000 [Altererythrobacter sp. CAU 1644]